MAEPEPPVRAQYFARHFRAAMTDADRRADAQQHLDSRSSRIGAYIASLETELARAQGGSVTALLERRLTQARRDLNTATRSQLAVAVPASLKQRVARSRAKAGEEQPGEEPVMQAVAEPDMQPAAQEAIQPLVQPVVEQMAAANETGS
jgi:hypothetical protein